MDPLPTYGVGESEEKKREMLSGYIRLFCEFTGGTPEQRQIFQVAYKLRLLLLAHDSRSRSCDDDPRNTIINPKHLDSFDGIK